jgi:hypothetical protein
MATVHPPPFTLHVPPSTGIFLINPTFHGIVSRRRGERVDKTGMSRKVLKIRALSGVGFEVRVGGGIEAWAQVVVKPLKVAAS